MTYIKKTDDNRNDLLLNIVKGDSKLIDKIRKSSDRLNRKIVNIEGNYLLFSHNSKHRNRRRLLLLVKIILCIIFINNYNHYFDSYYFY